ncbi:uncharacterized protein LOC143073203 [Mytilus galloprovincialis]|uniref:uncharacterized protein LOC143073203 n=1 Tax=Mytilus galloprovincialis TaxID=29158 RepID=UPI003F7BB6A7
MEIRVLFSHLEKYLVILMIVSDNFCVSYGNQCSFQNGKCTYEINLSNSNTECESKRTKIPMANENDIYGQNDEKMSRMQHDFHTVTEQHKNRIEELEASVQKLLRSAVAGPVSQQVKTRRLEDDQVIIGTLPQGTINHSESGLLKKLYDEFSILRTRLHKRTTQLLDTEAKLNETTHLFTKTQDELFDQGDKLMISEHKVATLEQERYILKNKVKHTTEQFKELQIRFNVTDAKVFDLENQLYTLVRSESNLKEEIGTYKWKLSQVEKAYGILQGNYSGLQQKLNKTEQTLQKAEFDLMECFTAKTQSFCGFEDDKVCGFTQEEEKDDFDWLRNVGRTPSSGTGPEMDHTCSEKKSGHYMFVEASGKNNGKKAILISPKYRGLKSQCLSFYYHMYGEHCGTLNVYTTTDFETELNSVWRAYGNQGNVWIKSTLEIPKALARTGYQVKFEAVTRLGYRGDISIDDISVEDGECGAGAIKVQYERNSTLTIDNHNLRRYKKFKDRMSRRRG